MQDTAQPQTARALCQSLKRDPKGESFSNLGADGVYRVFHASSYEVIDDVRLSTTQIKEFIDRWPFNQAIEDKFRGVDGRAVSDKDMLDPPENIRPQRPTEEQLREMHSIMEEQEREGVRKDSAAVCGVSRSNYNLDPI